ncbi:unnamed protein product, partial [marine sediment metagenome]
MFYGCAAKAEENTMTKHTTERLRELPEAQHTPTDHPPHLVVVANVAMHAQWKMRMMGFGFANTTMVLTNHPESLEALRGMDGSLPGVQLVFVIGWQNGDHWKRALNMLVYNRFTEVPED